MNPIPSSHLIQKKESLEAFILHFEGELRALIESAKAAHLAATHEESRAEDRHDTFAIEASYLASGQAARVQDLSETLLELRFYLETKGSPLTIEAGSLVSLESNGKITHSFVAHHGGGTQIKTSVGDSITLVSPHSPLGENLIGLSEADSFTLEAKSGERTYRVVRVR